MKYYLLDLERTIAMGMPAYWKKSRRGYTYRIDFAGAFTKDQAEMIVNNDIDDSTIMISSEQVERFLDRKIVAE